MSQKTVHLPSMFVIIAPECSIGVGLYWCLRQMEASEFHLKRSTPSSCWAARSAIHFDLPKKATGGWNGMDGVGIVKLRSQARSGPLDDGA